MITYLLVIIAFGIIWCSIGMTYFIMQNKELARVLEIQIRGLGATHLAGFEALTIEMQKLETRVKKVEDVMP